MTTKKAFHTSNLPKTFEELLNLFLVDPTPSDTIESRIQKELSKSFPLLSEDILDYVRINNVSNCQNSPEVNKIFSMAKSHLDKIIYNNNARIKIKQDKNVPQTMDFLLPLFAYSVEKPWCSRGHLRHEFPWKIEFNFMEHNQAHLMLSDGYYKNIFGVTTPRHQDINLYLNDCSYHKGEISANYVFQVKFELNSKAPIKTDLIKTNDLAVNGVSKYYSLFSQATKEYKSIQGLKKPEIGVLWVPKINCLKVDIPEPQYEISALVMTIGKDRYVIGYHENST